VFLGLFQSLRLFGVPVSLRELLDLHAAVDARLAFADREAFHALARTVMVKDERHYDRFDRAFGAYFAGIDLADIDLRTLIPDDWLRQDFRRQLSEEERAQIEALGGLEELIEQFRKRLEEQKGRHAGGNRWIGTGGTSPFGAGGFHPSGMRVGPRGGGRSAVKVWERRLYRNLDDSAELGPRNLQVALRRLRRFAREGAAEELDMPATIEATARDAGLLDIRMRPERRNAVKVLLFLDVGGSMDDHVRICESLFAACRSEFKRLEHFYFHNCLYDHVWKDGMRREHERIGTADILHRYGPDYKIVFVGDAAMAPWEVTHAGGSIEYWNEEAGEVWLRRIVRHFRKCAWVNPVPKAQWDYTQSNRIIRGLFEERMYPLTPEGLTEAMRHLAR
jgi:uncharacterized protein with von Willebrand factor type A (vWA) domain